MTVWALTGPAPNPLADASRRRAVRRPPARPPPSRSPPRRAAPACAPRSTAPAAACAGRSRPSCRPPGSGRGESHGEAARRRRRRPAGPRRRRDGRAPGAGRARARRSTSAPCARGPAARAWPPRSLAADGHAVTLVTRAGATTPAGRELRRVLADRGVALVDLGLDGTTPEKVRLRADGRPLLRLDRGGGTRRRGHATASRGRGRLAPRRCSSPTTAAGSPRSTACALRLAPPSAEACAVVWDPHPRGPPRCRACALVTPNVAEAAALRRGRARRAARPRVHRRGGRRRPAGRRALLAGPGGSPASPSRCGADGALLATAGDVRPRSSPPSPRTAATRAAPATGSPPRGRRAGGRRRRRRGAGAAVAAASAFVAAGGAGAFAAGRAPTVPARAGTDGAPGHEALALAAAVRARGGTVVATGGCFDLLHPGHVADAAGGPRARRLPHRAASTPTPRSGA